MIIFRLTIDTIRKYAHLPIVVIYTSGCSAQYGSPHSANIDTRRAAGLYSYSHWYGAFCDVCRWQISNGEMSRGIACSLLIFCICRNCCQMLSVFRLFIGVFRWCISLLIDSIFDPISVSNGISLSLSLGLYKETMICVICFTLFFLDSYLKL